MYHLYTFEDKLKVLLEAKRVAKKGGVIAVAYCMNEFRRDYACFRKKILQSESAKDGKLSKDFHCQTTKEDLCSSYVRIEDINALQDAAGLQREQIVAADGAANYIRPVLNAMDEEKLISFSLTIIWQLVKDRNCSGASAHTLDILRKESV